MTPEEIKTAYDNLLASVEEKAKALSVKRNIEVHGYVITIEQTEEKQDYAVIFYEEPKRATKLRVADKLIVAPVSAGEILLQACLIKEESDPRIATNDVLYLTLCNQITESIQTYTTVVKKN